MKKRNRILALILAAALILCLLAACSSSTNSDTSTDANSSSNDSSNTSDTNDTETNDTSDSESEDSGTDASNEIITIEFYAMDGSGRAADYGEHVFEYMNEITEKEIGVHVNFHAVAWGNYTTEVNLGLVSGDTMDLVQCFPLTPLTFNEVYLNGHLMEIGDLLKEYAPDAYNMMEKYLGAYTRDGGIYGIPTNRDLATNSYIAMRKDVLDELGIYDQAMAMTSWADFEEILAIVKDWQTSTGSAMYPMAYGGETTCGSSGAIYGETFADTTLYDTLSSVYLMTDNEGHISNYFASDAALDNMLLKKKWADNGWIWPDSSLTSDNGDPIMRQGMGFCQIIGSEFTVETAKTTEWQTDVKAVMINGGFIKGSALTSWGLYIPRYAEEPEAACKFINLLYTNQDLINAWVNGVEGVDYEVNEAGEAQALNDGNVYAQGDFMIGNQFLTLPGAGAGGDAREISQQLTEACEVSPYLSFSIDTTQVEEYLANMGSAYDQYGRDLGCGGYTEEKFADFTAKLEAAGINEYVAECQRQLDAWMAAQ